VRRILRKIASQGGVLHSPMPSPMKIQVNQGDGSSTRSPAGEGNAVAHVNLAVVEAVNRPDKYGYTPLMVAVSLGFTGKGVSSPRSRSSSSNSSPKVSVANAAGDNGSGIAVTATAASVGLRLCAMLLEMEADPVLSDDSGMTAIHWAAQAGDAQVLQFLLVQCSEKLTASLLKPIASDEPLKEIAVIMDSAEVCAKAFAEAWETQGGASSCSTSGSSGDGLCEIAPQKLSSLEQILSVTCHAGDTALHVAARHANVECIKVLFRAGASSLKRNYACETPYDVIAVSFPGFSSRFFVRLHAVPVCTRLTFQHMFSHFSLKKLHRLHSHPTQRHSNVSWPSFARSAENSSLH
jgi:hypothetical protein